MRAVRIALVIALSMLAVVPARAGGPSTCPAPLPIGDEPVELDPADFVDHIDNPYWPMAPGTRWVYRESDGRGGEQKVVVTVKVRTRRILGIDATVVRDVVTEQGEPIEDTFDWFAQDACGNVWYLGERSKEYENGKVVSTEGSWEAGIDGAQAGVVMPAEPAAGLSYRQEHYAGHAEDAAQVLSLEERAQVPVESFRDVLLTKDFTPLEPRVLEYKLYARGVGPVLVLGVSGGSAREELVRVVRPA